MDFVPMKGPLYALLMASAALIAMPAKADVYKCTINGETRYQDEPCPGDRDAAPHLEFESDPQPVPPPAPPPEATSEPPSSSQPAPPPAPPSSPQPAPPSAAPSKTSSANEPAESAPIDEATQASDPEAARDARRTRRVRNPPTAPPPEDDSPLDRTARLGVDIANAEQELRAVVDARRDALAAIDVRMAAGGRTPALEAEREQREASFRERRLEVASRLARLKAELQAQCPNGTFQNVHRLACR